MALPDRRTPVRTAPKSGMMAAGAKARAVTGSGRALPCPRRHSRMRPAGVPAPMAGFRLAPIGPRRRP